MSTIRISKKLKTALKKLGESGESYQTIVANLRLKVIASMVELIASEIYGRESLTKRFEIMTPLEEIETYVDSDGTTMFTTSYKWADGKDDVVCPMIYKSFDIAPEYSVDKIKQEAEACVRSLLRIETMLLSKMTSSDHIYLSLPFQIMVWGDPEYTIYFSMRTCLTSSATPTFEEACEATRTNNSSS